MAESKERIGVEAVVEGIEEFEKRLQRYNQRLAEAEKATEAYAEKVSTSSRKAAAERRKAAQAAEDAANAVIMAEEREQKSMASLVAARESLVSAEVAYIEAQNQTILTKQQLVAADMAHARTVAASDKERTASAMQVLDAKQKMTVAAAMEESALQRLILAQAGVAKAEQNASEASARRLVSMQRAEAAARKAAAADASAAKDTKEGAKEVVEASKEEEEAHKSTIDIIHEKMLAMRQLRWEIITAMFYFRMIGMAARSAWNTVSEAYDQHIGRVSARALASAYDEDLGAVVASLQGITDGTMSVTQAVEVALRGMIATQGQFTDQYASLWQAAEVIATVTGGEVVDVFTNLASAIADADVGAAQSVATFYDITGAVEEYAQAQGTTADKLSDVERRSAILNAVMGDTNIMLANGADEAVNTARSASELSDAWSDFTQVVFASLDVMGEFAKFTDWLIGGLDILAGRITKVASFAAGMAAVFEEIYGRQPLSAGTRSLMPFAHMVSIATGAMNLLRDEGFGGFSDTYMSAYESRMKSAEDVLNDFAGANTDLSLTIRSVGESMVFTEDNMSSAINHLLNYQNILDRHNERLQDIEESHIQNMEKARDKYMDRLLDAQNRYDKDVQKAIDKYNTNVEKRLRETYDRRQYDLERHLQRMLHNEESYLLRQVQNQREYEYQRDLLVARGDVLAIEDLDARNAMRVQADKENFEMRQRQAQEAFDLQQAYQRDSLDKQLDDLRKSLDDQLRELTDRYNERVQEAKESYDKEIIQAEVRRQEMLDKEARDFEKQKRQWAEHWATLVRTTELSAEQVNQILTGYFGDSGIVDIMMAQFMERRALEIAIIDQLLQSVNQSVATASGEAAIAAMTATQALIGMSGSHMQPYLPVVTRTHTGGTFQAPAMPAMPPLSMGWSGDPIPISITDPSSGRTQTIQMTDAMMIQLLQALTAALRVGRAR